MTNLFLGVLTLIFLVESFLEVRLYSQIHALLSQSAPTNLNRRVARIIKIENQWSWVSWIFLLLLFVLPDNYTFLLICVITLVETWVVYELQNAKNYAESQHRQ